MTALIEELLDRSAVHDEWRPLLGRCLQQVDSDYLKNLVADTDWLPGQHRLFAAFQRDRQQCRYILLGESPYPRAESANGIAFYDAAVDQLWSDQGLSKAVNRATSLRNIMKTALLAQGLIKVDEDGKIPQSSIAAIDNSKLIQTIDELFSRLQQQGFLLFNATPVLHPANPPAREARYWQGFLACLLSEIDQAATPTPTLVLWGKIAQQIEQMPTSINFPRIRSEHPYNLSFIHNPDMQQLFSQLQLL
ncbi:MAG: uracil-DNA glycosylase [Gammaproteobacteria bacterium]|nr:uracil-DNA glycosylase [Gammaproteobacteria bacterium]